jgi:hypothetical protein
MAFKLDWPEEECLGLFWGLHCDLSIFRLVYALNEGLHLGLVRRKENHGEKRSGGVWAEFLLFERHSPAMDLRIFLIRNQSLAAVGPSRDSGLFAEQSTKHFSLLRTRDAFDYYFWLASAARWTEWETRLEKQLTTVMELKAFQRLKAKDTSLLANKLNLLFQ